MYATLWTKPNDEGAVLHRLVDDTEAGGPMSIQPTENSQQILLEVVYRLMPEPDDDPGGLPGGDSGAPPDSGD